MPFVITCAYTAELCEMSQSLLRWGGLNNPVPSARHGLDPKEINDRILASRNIDPSEASEFTSVQFGKAWEIIASDLILANSTFQPWGWGDPVNIFFLQAWRSFDDECRFFFLYESLRDSLTQILTAPGRHPVHLSEEVRRWKNFHKTLLGFYEENKERCIFAHKSILKRPSDVSKLCEDRLGIRAIPADASLPTAGAAKPLENLGAYILQEIGEENSIYDALQEASDMPGPSMADEPKSGEDAWQDLGRLHVDALSRASLIEENEFMLLQLNQLQDELEYSFTKLENLSSSDAGQSANFDDAQPIDGDIYIDMRGYINGQNWYPPECTGRWAGPDVQSTISIPPLTGGNYVIELDVAGAVTPDIINKARIFLDGVELKPTAFLLPGARDRLAPLRRLRAALLVRQRAIPRVLRCNARVTKDNVAQHELRIEFPYTEYPRRLKSKDARLLAVFVRSILIQKDVLSKTPTIKTVAAS